MSCIHFVCFNGKNVFLLPLLNVNKCVSPICLEPIVVLKAIEHPINCVTKLTNHLYLRNEYLVKVKKETKKNESGKSPKLLLSVIQYIICEID